jgi:tetratricopeptide (TPR) repeat protein
MPEPVQSNVEMISNAMTGHGEDFYRFLNAVMNSPEVKQPELLLAAADALLADVSSPLKASWLRLLTGYLHLRIRDYSQVGMIAGKLIGEELHSGQLRSHALFLKAQALFANAIIDETKATCEKAITLYDEDDDNITSLHMNILGACHRQLNEFQNALNYYNMALEREKKVNPERLYCGIYYNMAIVYVELGNLTDAQEALARVLEIEKEKGNATMVAHAKSSIADLLQQQGKPEEGLKYAESAFAEFRDVENPHIRTVNLLVLSDLHLTLGNFEKALEYAEECLSFSERTSEKFLILEAKLAHAVVLAGMKNPRAEEKLHEALGYFEETESGKPQMNLEKAFIEYGKILMEKNDPGAYGYFIRAEKYLGTRPLTPQIETIFADLREQVRKLQGN